MWQRRNGEERCKNYSTFIKRPLRAKKIQNTSPDNSTFKYLPISRLSETYISGYLGGNLIWVKEWYFKYIKTSL